MKWCLSQMVLLAVAEESNDSKGCVGCGVSCLGGRNIRQTFQTSQMPNVGVAYQCFP